MKPLGTPSIFQVLVNYPKTFPRVNSNGSMPQSKHLRGMLEVVGTLPGRKIFDTTVAKQLTFFHHVAAMVD